MQWMIRGHIDVHSRVVMLNQCFHNLRSGVLFSEEHERKATRDSAVSQALVRREKKFFSLF